MTKMTKAERLEMQELRSMVEGLGKGMNDAINRARMATVENYALKRTLSGELEEIEQNKKEQKCDPTT